MDRTLIPAVVQHHLTGEVLMVAYMNDLAIRKTRETGLVHFWSRSRDALWQKGETSGNQLRVVEIRLDCDNDTLLVRAAPSGPTCHTGHKTCFFTDGDEGPAASALEALYRVVQTRKQALDAGAADSGSYTRKLLDGGPAKIISKIVEECGEFCAELPDGSDEKVVYECADLLYHVLVGLGSRNISPERIFVELGSRMGVSGFEAKAMQKPGPSTEQLARAGRPLPRKRAKGTAPAKPVARRKSANHPHSARPISKKSKTAKARAR